MNQQHNKKEDKIKLRPVQFFGLLLGVFTLGVILIKPEGIFTSKTKDVLIIGLLMLNVLD